ncbi:histone lysine demethylase JMJD6a [Cardiosporidium cionae]|uniref:Histone lysine demethylase JMJD6a n=1 Tax=Cardiosporidium cionae TaxID=476202 RepID=A0ABQ7JB15_9APIC|nr:histone lysine demethylase JMJD6a [Cardiosporidium cionae]|eukprot:KAF8821196.1 histone lysine demethylase JMJD6a [Cardiosporidium cionae]
MESSSSPLCSTISAASLPNPSLPLSPSPMVSSGSPSVVYDHRKSESIIYYAKKQHRTDIRPRNWSKNSYFKSSLCEHALTLISTVPYLDRSLSTVEEFYSLYEKAGIPVILRGWIDDWPAFSEWTLEKLEKNYKRSSFKVGEDDDGHRIKMRMKYFMDYLRHQQDDSPLYLFESAVEERISTSKLLKDWQVPDVFPFDLHGLLGEEMRPPYRWFCIGPKRSGSSIHIDPMGTSAWNALIQGYKWWVMCPSGTDKTIVKGKHLWKEGEADEAIVWFDKILPRIKATYPQVKFLEVVQKAGEVIFVPPGWWHAVLNLNDSISCTQNFVSPANFDLAWICARQSRPKLAYVWLNRLKYFLPELHARAVYLNECVCS